MEPPVQETVYLRRHLEGWSVSLDDGLLHVSCDEEAAFEVALAAYRDEPARRRMVLLSGPMTGACPDALHQTLKLAAV